jgi:hypothetical protein
MNTKDLTTSFTVDQSPEDVYNAINNVRGWWSETIEGGTEQLNDEFTYRYKDMHYSKQKLVEMVPGKKIVWLVEDGWLSFVKKRDEWIGTKIIFEISRKGSRTEVKFTHEGFLPGCECFEACTGGWNYYLHESLLPLITSGNGHPN